MKTHDTLIIGGGISGLACARKLQDEGKEFILITKDLGGRMLTSKANSLINFGASYITSEYKLTSNYITKGEKIKLVDCYFNQGGSLKTIFSFNILPQLPRLAKLYILLNKYLKEFAKFRKDSLEIGQKQALLKSKLLKEYTDMSATEFIKKYKLESLDSTFLSLLFTTTVFEKVKNGNAAYYLSCLAPIIRTTHGANFTQTIEKLTKGFEDKVIIDEVIGFEKKNDGFLVRTRTDNFSVKKIVIAIPYIFAIKLYNIPKTGPIVPIKVLNVRGVRNENYKDKKIVFLDTEKGHDITILWGQEDGSDLLFSNFERPHLERYYDKYEIIEVIDWENSLMLSGNSDSWIEHKLENNLYIASDYNMCGLEDSFISGTYAANSIIRNEN